MDVPYKTMRADNYSINTKSLQRVFQLIHNESAVGEKGTYTGNCHLIGNQKVTLHALGFLKISIFVCYQMLGYFSHVATSRVLI